MIGNLLTKYYLLFSVFVVLMVPMRSWSKETNRDEAYFVKNVGQIVDTNMVPVKAIDYQLCAKGTVIFVGNGMLQYQWHKTRPKKTLHAEQLSDKRSSDSVIADIYTMQMLLVGANKNAVAVSEQEQAYYENFYLPYCNGKTAHSFGKIIYKDIYPNIDWVLYTTGTGDAKYDFIVRPGGKVSDIKIQYKNAASLYLKDGDMHAVAAVGNIKEAKPYTYRADNREKLSSSFVLRNNILSFEVGNADHYNNTIVIDPVLNWGTYFVPDSSLGFCIAADTFGSSYLCGYTYKLTSVTSSGAYLTTYAGGVLDAFISKYDIDGVKLWSTYYGGPGTDKILAATCNLGGDLFVAGATTSVSMISGGVNPEKRTFSSFPGGSINDAFLARFSPAGSFIWGTYAGGYATDNAQAVVCDNAGSVYIGGFTTDTTSDTTGHFYKGYQSKPGPGFFSRYNISDGRRVWSSFFNGDIKALATDNRGNLFIGGTSNIYVNVATPGTHMPLYLSGAYKGFICKFKKEGTRSWGTYYGGDKDDDVYSLACDSLGGVYAGGVTYSDTGIASPAAYQKRRMGLALAAGFITRLDSFGKRSWGSYYSGIVNAIKLSPDHKLYIGGDAVSDTGVTTPDAYQLTFGGAFMAKWSIDGKMLYGTYYSGRNLAYLTVAYGGTFGGINGGNRIFIGSGIGNDRGTIDIATPNAYQPLLIGITGFITQFKADTSVYIKFPYTDTLLCAGGPLNLAYGVTNLFRPGNAFTVQLSDVTGSFSSPVNIGSLSYNDRYNINCTIPLNMPEGIGYRVRIVSSAPADTFYNYDMPVRISHYPHPTATTTGSICANLSLTMLDSTVQPPDTRYSWFSPNPARIPGTANPNIVTAITLADSGDYIVVADNHSCIGKDTIHVHVNVAPPEPTVTGDTSLCVGDTLRLKASSPVAGVTFAWFKPYNSFVGFVPNIEVQNVTLADAGKYRISAERDGCISDPLYGQVVTVHPLPRATAYTNSPICEDDTLRLSGSDTLTVNYAWSGPANFTSSHKDTILTKTIVASGGVYTLKTTTIHGCTSMASAAVTVKPSPKIEASSNSPLCRKDDLKLNAGNGAANASYSWTGPNSYTANTQNVIIPSADFGQAGVYKIKANLDGCIREDSTTVIVSEGPDKPKLSSNSPLFTGEVLKLNILNALSHISYTWAGPNGFISQLTNPVINNATPAMSGKYTVIARVGGCTAYDTITVVVTDASGNNNKNDLLVFPNPNNGVFRVKGTTKENNVISLAVFASDGRRIYETTIQPANNIIDQTINIGAVANGVYRLKIWIDGRMIPVSFTVKQ